MTNGILQHPRKIQKKEDTSNFDCGVESLNEWIKRYAWKNHRAKKAVVYVATLNGEVVGYYALSSGGVARASLPDDLPGGRRPHMVPVIVLGRFAVDKRMQGKGLGRSLLKDMLERALAAAEIVGAMGIVLHAHDEAAKAFYLHNADFVEMPGEPLHLLLPLGAVTGPHVDGAPRQDL